MGMVLFVMYYGRHCHEELVVRKIIHLWGGFSFLDVRDCRLGQDSDRKCICGPSTDLVFRIVSTSTRKVSRKPVLLINVAIYMNCHVVLVLLLLFFQFSHGARSDENAKRTNHHKAALPPTNFITTTETSHSFLLTLARRRISSQTRRELSLALSLSSY